MSDVFRAVKISDNVFWVGAVDWNIRDFHGYTTHRGSTYNAYLIMADKVTLIDTVRLPFKDEMLSRIRSVVEPEKIEYIVSNHSEMDHTGSLPETVRTVNPERVFASSMGEKALREHFDMGDKVTPVRDGDIIGLGDMELRVMETRMLHWPDSMFTYLASNKLLFSQDAFGMHLASSQRFDDEMDPSVLDYEAATYFANILMPYSSMLLKLLQGVKGSGIDIRLIAPDHGPVWRKGVSGIMKRYEEWSLKVPTEKTVVFYDTMWHSTELMARAVVEGVSSAGGLVKLMSMSENHRSDVAFEVLDAGAVIVGSPTLNNNIFPSMADVLTYLRGLRPKNLIGAAFGSSGWSGETIKQLEGYLSEIGVDIAAESVAAKYVPNASDLDKSFSLGVAVAKALQKRVSAV